MKKVGSKIKMPKFEYRNEHQMNQNINTKKLVTDLMVKDYFFIDLLPDHIMKTNNIPFLCQKNIIRKKFLGMIFWESWFQKRHEFSEKFILFSYTTWVWVKGIVSRRGKGLRIEKWFWLAQSYAYKDCKTKILTWKLRDLL